MERIKLNLIPSGVAPTVHLSQYDDGRQFAIDLFEGDSVYVLDGTETLTVDSRKPDGHIVTLTVTNTGTSSVVVDTVEQLTAVHGQSYAKLKIEKGSVTIATLEFLIAVSRDPSENGDPSDSFIQNLETQVNGFVATAVADQYDSANVIFDSVPTAGHGNGYAVTSEGVKNAIDALGTPSASDVSYDNTGSGLSATDVQDAIDEVNGNIPANSDFSLSGLSDTTITTPSNNQLLGYSGGKWVNKDDNSMRCAYASQSSQTQYNVNYDNLVAVSGRTFGMALVFAWKDIFALFYTSDSSVFVKPLTPSPNRTASVNWNSVTRNIEITFDQQVWLGISVYPV